MRRSSPGLGPFLQTLQDRLAALSPDEVREALLAHAERLPARDRDGFLAMFPPPGRRVAAGRPRLVESDPTDPLLRDIERFVEKARSGDFVQGWGWDDDSHDERAFGDESWVQDLDDEADTDIDLLVVFRSVADKRATAVALRRAIADVPAPVDFLVTDEAETARRGRIDSRWHRVRSHPRPGRAPGPPADGSLRGPG